MRLFPKIFPETVSSVVEAGEKGGSLENNLLFIAESIKKEYELTRKMKGAVIYPTIIISLTMFEFIGMIFIVLPKMEALFSSFPNIPPLTMFILRTANGVRENWMIILGVLLVIIIAIAIYLKTKSGKNFKGWLAINFPIIKKNGRAHV